MNLLFIELSKIIPSFIHFRNIINIEIIVTLFLLLLYLIIMVKLKINNTFTNLGVAFSLIICVISILLSFDIDKIVKEMDTYETLLYPLLFAVLLFVLNFNSSKILNKPFSFYFSKYTGSLVYILIPLIIRIIVIFIPIKLIDTSVIVLFSIVFYSYFTFSTIIGVFEWDKGDLVNKYSELYIEALIDFPYAETIDNDLFYQWQCLKDSSNISIDYKIIYTERLNRLSVLKESTNRLELDQFTIRLIELSVIEQNESDIQLSNNGLYNFYKPFFEKVSTKFLSKLLMFPNFKLNHFDSKETFSYILNQYIIRQNKSIDFMIYKDILIRNRNEDLDNTFINKEYYLALYNCNVIDELILNLKYVDDIDSAVILESIVLTHNDLLKYTSPKNIYNGKIVKYNYNFEDIKYGKIFDDVVFENYETFIKKVNELESLFANVSLRVHFNFNIENVINTEIYTSQIINEYYEKYYYVQKRKLNHKQANVEVVLVKELNTFLLLANYLFYNDSKKKDEIKKDVKKVIMHYSRELFDNQQWEQIDYLVDNYNVSNGILEIDLRKKIENNLRINGKFDIPIFNSINEQNSIAEKEEIIRNFLDEYSSQLENTEKYFYFYDANELVKHKYYSKVQFFKFIVQEIGKTDSELVNELGKYRDYNIALGIAWVYDKSGFDKIVDKSNYGVIEGVHQVLEYIHTLNSPDIEKKKEEIGIDSLGYFYNKFVNLKVLQDTDTDQFRCVNYIEDIGIPYTIKNLDDKSLEIISDCWSFYLGEMSESIEFIKNLLDSDFDITKQLDCNFLCEVNTILNSKESNAKSKKEILINLIDKISDSRVKSEKYSVKNIFEYDKIIKFYKEVQSDEVKTIFTNKIVSRVEKYFISEILDDLNKEK